MTARKPEKMKWKPFAHAKVIGHKPRGKEAASFDLGDRIEAEYELELERRRETEAELRQALLREDHLLRKKDELIQQKDELIRQKNDLIDQKDIFCKESEHRFLNGLQLVASLLSAQSREFENPEVAA